MSSQPNYPEAVECGSNEVDRSRFLHNVCKHVKEQYTEFLRKLGVEEHIVHEYLEQGDKSLRTKLTVLQNSTTGISFYQLYRLIEAVERELHGTERLTIVDDLIGEIGKPLVTTARDEAWFLYNIIDDHDYNDLLTIAETHFGIIRSRYRSIVDNYSGKREQCYRLMIEWKDGSRLSSIDDMLCKLEELQVPIPETYQRAFDEPPAVTSSNLHVVRPLSDALITTPPIHNEIPNSSRFNPAFCGAPRASTKHPCLETSPMYRRSEGIIPNETYEQGNSSVNEVPHINRETIASNQPGFEASRIATDRTEPEHVKKQGTVHPADDANVGSMSCQASSSTSAFSSVLVDGSTKDSTSGTKTFETKSQSPELPKPPLRSSRQHLDTPSCK